MEGGDDGVMRGMRVSRGWREKRRGWREGGERMERG